MTKEKAAKVSLLESRRATKSAKQAGYKRAPSISKVPEEFPGVSVDTDDSLGKDHFRTQPSRIVAARILNSAAKRSDWSTLSVSGDRRASIRRRSHER